MPIWIEAFDLMKKHRLVCTLVFLLTTVKLLAQQSDLSLTLGVTDGLSSSLTYDMLTDEEGFLWISNRMGVDRYDGYAFKPYHLAQRPDDVLQLEDVNAIT